MENTTLCYLERNGKYLMLYRNKKENDVNGGKYVGVGGHFEENESPYDCVAREVREETGLIMNAPVYRGIVTFCSNNCECEQMHLFTCNDFSGKLADCNEGELKWVDKSEVEALPMWAGDIYFLRMLNNCNTFFSMKLVYENDVLKEYYLNGKKQEI